MPWVPRMGSRERGSQRIQTGASCGTRSRQTWDWEGFGGSLIKTTS